MSRKHIHGHFAIRHPDRQLRPQFQKARLMRQLSTSLLSLAILAVLTQSSSLLYAQRPGDDRPGRGERGFQRPDGPPAFSPFLDLFDTNRDGEISAAEIRNAAGIVRKLDKNRDGQITPDELGPPPGERGFRGPGGPRGPNRQTIKLVKEFDKDGNGRLDVAERKAARASLANRQNGGRPGRRRGPQNRPSVSPGPKVSPADVQSIPDAPLYQRNVLRTLFLEFENEDWEAELAAFKETDVEVPATVTVDGKKYPGVGVKFRGMSSFHHVPAGHKRSLNLSVDFIDDTQRLHGYKTLNLLNCNGDPSMMSTVLYSHLASAHLPVPQANFVKVVINGRSWGVYANVEQFNKQFIAKHYGTTEGARWKVSGNPQADGGLRYLGEDVAGYRERFEIKSKDRPESWQALIALCRTLDKTPPEKLEEALKPILDVDGLLWFLAFDVALVNSDGYWTRASDYSIYLDPKGKFHILPHDMNEAMREGRPGPPGGLAGRGGPGERPGAFPPGRERPGFQRPGPEDQRPNGQPGRPGFQRPDFRRRGFQGRNRRGGFGRPGGGPPGGPGGGHGGVDLEPLVGLDNPRMPLRSKVLAVPALKQRYLQHVRTIAATSLDWKTLGPVVAQCRALLIKEIEADTRKLEPFEAFLGVTSAATPRQGQQQGPSLRGFADQRRRFLLDHADIKKLPRQ